MSQIIESLNDVSDRYSALLVDLWGCVHNGCDPFPEAVEALQKYRRDGRGTVVVLTNSPRPRDSVERQLTKIGVPSDAWDAIATSGDSARSAMLMGAVGQKVYHIGPEHDLSFFKNMELIPDAVQIERVTLNQAEGIVCTGPVDDTKDVPEDYRATFLAAKNRGLKLLCANPDIVVDRGETRVYCAGALAKLYTEMDGESLYFGKPHPPIYDLAYRRLSQLGVDVDKERMLAIGDGIITDVQGAMGEDIDCLFITGGLAAKETATDRQPDPQKLSKFLDSAMLSPQYSIGHLR
jgi:HAD superfamily hydrolase (TIGR01459 family)